MGDDQKRPNWPDHFSISEDNARWLFGRHITKITHHWEMTGVDTARDWIECHDDKGKKKRFRRLPSEVQFRPYHAGLLDMRRDVMDAVKLQDDWDRQHKRDLAELARLQDKLGVTVPPRSQGEGK